jgi:hypothetical protein
MADQIRPNPEPQPIPHAPGNICVTLRPSKFFGNSSLMMDEISDVIISPVAA